MSKLKLRQDEFIEKINKKYNYSFDCSKLIYVDTRTKITLICKTHGDFEIYPEYLLNSNNVFGCKKCRIDNEIEFYKNEFIKKSNEIHAFKYDYSKVIYKKNNVKVIIICEKHGEFLMCPQDHLKGNNCPKCKIVTSESFIKKAQKIHGDLYDYSKVNYVHSKQEIIVSCFNHGDFLIKPSEHLRNIGCKLCSTDKLKNNFILRANEIYGDKYIYDAVIYKNMSTEVKIICKKHNIFVVSPNNHLKGSECSECLMEQNTSVFINKALQVHGNIYNYSKVKYISCDKKVIITCNKHGDYEICPTEHLKGHKCFYCSYNTKNKKEFIEEAKKLHKDQYIYDEINFISMNKICNIKCKNHGEFNIKPYNHLKGQGCSKCFKEKLYTNLETFIINAKKIHGETYDYSNVIYENGKMHITCKIHGIFKQVPSKHIAGQGCIKCKNKTEGLLFNKLKNEYSNVIHNFNLHNCKNINFLPFDILLTDYKIIVELDGEQHFRQVRDWKNPKEQQKNDIYKMKCANEDGYSIIRLLQEDVYHNKYDWFVELINNINTLKLNEKIMNIFMHKNGEYDDLINNFL